MKKKWGRTLVLVVFLLTLAATAHACLGVRWKVTFEAVPSEVKWEYRVVSISLDSRIEDGTFERELNELGAGGWELSEIVVTQSIGYYIMKRVRS